MHRRILLLITDLEIGGTPTVVRELAKRLRDAGRHVHVEVACLGGWGPVADQMTEAGVRVTAPGARGVWDFPRTVHRLNHLLGSRVMDTCFSFLVHANAVAFASSLFLHEVKYFQSIQTTQVNPRWHWRVQRVIHHGARAVVVPTESVARVAWERSGISREKVVVIPNAVEVGELSGLVRRGGEGKYRVVFIGRLDRVKRVGDLIEAMGYLPGDTELHIYGDGPERGNLRGGERVYFHGAIDGAGEGLARADVLVLPSEAEGFGLVLIEAMAAGVPVVGTEVDGIRDVVREGRTGLLAPVGSPRELAGAIMRIRGDEKLRSALIENGKAEVAQHYSWEGVIEQYRKVLNIETKEEE